MSTVTPRYVSEEVMNRVLGYLIRQVKLQGGREITISFEDIMDGTKYSHTTIAKALKDLVEQGVLERVRGGGRVPYTYRYNGPTKEQVYEVKMRDFLREKIKELRLLRRRDRRYADFARRIVELKKQGDYYILKVLPAPDGSLGIPWGKNSV